MTGKQVREYIENELGCDPVHEVNALACAIEDMANELEKRKDGKRLIITKEYWLQMIKEVQFKIDDFTTKKALSHSKKFR